VSKQGILNLAEAIKEAATVMVHSGDREPGSTLSTQGKRWVVAGLRLLANKRKKKKSKK
jgi:hypothetical protein